MGSFSISIDQFCDKANSNVKTVIRAISLEAFKRIILKTPVDTGRARANWAVKTGSPNTSFQIESEDKSGSATLTAAADGVQSWLCQGSIFITNNLPYIGVLEYGRADGSAGSSQAPNGMVRITVEEMRAWAGGKVM